MAWTAPITFVNGVALTAAQLNAMQANILETAAAKATTAGQHFAATGANALAARMTASDVQDSIQTTTSTSYVTTSEPTVTLTTGPLALVFLFCYITINTNSESAFWGFQVSGATTSGFNDNRSIAFARFTVQIAMQCSAAILVTGLTPGSNTFTCGRRVTNAAATGTFDHRRIAVLPF